MVKLLKFCSNTFLYDPFFWFSLPLNVTISPLAIERPHILRIGNMSIQKEIMLTVCIVEILPLNCQVSFQRMTQHNDYMNTE